MAGVGMYVCACLVSYIVLSFVFEGSGHPPMPGAPDWLYVGVFFVVLPLVALGFAAYTFRRVCLAGVLDRRSA